MPSNFGRPKPFWRWSRLAGLWNPRARPQLIAALHAVDFFFVLPLGAGVGSAIVVASKVIPQLLKTYPEQMNGFFLAHPRFYLRSFSFASATRPPAMVFGGVLCCAGLQSGGATGRINPQGPLVAFFAGAIAICAMILPGVSGSYLLKAMGQYEYILTQLHDALALQTASVFVIVCFLAGIALGITTFARVLSWLLKEKPSLTFSALVGLMLGALRSVWPFQTPNKMPALPESWGTIELQSLAAMMLGTVVVGLLLYLVKKSENSQTHHADTHA